MMNEEAEKTQKKPSLEMSRGHTLLNLSLLFTSSMLILILLTRESFQLQSQKSLFFNLIIGLNLSLIIFRLWHFLKHSKSHPQADAPDAQEASDLKIIIILSATATCLAVIYDYILNSNTKYLTQINLLFLLLSLILIVLASKIQHFFTQKQRIMKAIINLQGILAFLLLFLAATEGATRSLIALNILPDIPHREEVDADFLPNVHILSDTNGNSEPAHPDFTGFIVNSELNIWLPKNFSGKYYRVENSFRHTTNSPKTYKNTIYVFGGSTIFSRQVPDKYTIPSYLQRYLNAEFGNRFRVVNAGVDGYLLQHQNLRLRQINLLPGDLVIYYDGENDTLLITKFALYQGTPIPTAMSSLDEANSSESSAKIREKKYQFLLSIHHLLVHLGRFSEFFHLLQTHNWQLSQYPINDADWLEGIVDTHVENYNNRILEAKEYTNSQGAVFLHYLQPTLFSQTKFTPHEQLIMESFGEDYTYRAIQQGYIDQNPELIAKGVHTVDLTSILEVDLRPAGMDIYFDHCHINHIGNQIVAKAIFEDLRSLLK